MLLWQYPSLFTVKLGKVWITTLCDTNDNDINSWQTSVTIDFYEFQLRRFGAYLVPISRLFETQTQASKYVKLISGKNLNDFIKFLKSHSDVFTITSDECVVLSDHLQRASLNGHTITRIDAPIVLDEKVYENTRIIVNTYHGRQIIDTIFQTTNVVTVDLEGVNLGSIRGSITLVQLAFLPKHIMNGFVENSNTSNTANSSNRIYPKIFIFDVLSNPNLVNMCLKHLLESNKIKKVFHGCEDDSYALYRDFGIVLNNFIDTQAAHIVINSISNEDNCDNNIRTNGQQSEAIGLNGLFQLYGGYGSNPLKAVVKKRYVGNSNYWCYRPMTEEMVYYAAYDVYVLLGIYSKMCALIAQITDQNLALLHDLNMRSAFGRIRAEQDRNPEHKQNQYYYKRRQPFNNRRQNNYNRSKTYR